jgi:hypothetical protein
MTNSKHKKLFIILSAIILILGIGIAIPKLTVYDTVPVSAQLKRCTDSATDHFYNPLERLALALGKSRIVETQGPAEAMIEFYTIFRIPLGVVRGQPDMKLGVFCNMIDPDDWSASTK